MTNVPEVCAQLGITDVVLSPGSRCAPLTLAFARHPGITVRTVPDERAAAFIGLGIAQAQRRAVALVCTSGTAGLNYAPAVAEAFFQQIPLVVFTADRPPEWIDQLDGQTIRQTNLYGAHAKGAFTLPVDLTHPDAKWHATRLVNEAINLAQRAPAGPVQVNVPLREPFYPKADEAIAFDAVKVIREVGGTLTLPESEVTALLAGIRSADRLLVVAGQHPRDRELQQALQQFAASLGFGVAVVGDTISNIHGPEMLFFGRQDISLAGLKAEQKTDLQPDLLITFGQSLISKALKLFLRDAAPAQHWHIQAAGEVADTFRSLTRVIRTEPRVFFQTLAAVAIEDASAAARQYTYYYYETWDLINSSSTIFLENFFQQPNPPFNEFSTIHQALALLPEYTALHLANSMAVRYANIIGLPPGRAVEVFANRGTSGIDGCTSTAVGAALAQPGRPVVLLTGDVAFFYDRNAFWQNYPTPNLRVILLNNHAGGIFRLIDGPRQQPELEEFFETRQPLRAENTARDFGLRYSAVSTFSELESALPVFFATEGGAALLEITTDSATNAAFFEEYRKAVKQAFS